MLYTLLIYSDEQWMIEHDAREDHADDMGAFVKEVADKIRGGAPLAPSTSATSVRVRDGEVLMTDGPFAETKETLAGFFLIEAQDLDEALEIAAKNPVAKAGTIEVRPVATEILSAVNKAAEA